MYCTISSPSPQDGWLGNEHGPGSLKRFISEPVSISFGFYWDHIKAMSKFLSKMDPKRYLVV
jgi:hypothetical protein